MIYDAFAKRNFYRQTGNFSFNIDITLNSVSGHCDLGFSGDGTFKFSLRSGKILDHQQNFIGVYDENIATTISGNVSNDKLDYYINGFATAFGVPRTSGAVDYFYVNPTNVTADFTLAINGETPLYTYTDEIIYHTGDIILIGYLTNLSQPFKIFSGTYLGDLSTSFISGFPTGEVGTGTHPFYLAQNGILGETSFPFTIYTNFGPQFLNVRGSGIGDNTNSIGLTVDEPDSLAIANNNTLIFHSTYYSATGEMPLSVSLRMISGTGDYYRPQRITGYYSGVISGYIVETGNLTGLFNPAGSGINPYGEIFTGITTGKPIRSVAATGWFPYDFITTGTGSGASNGFTGIATGIMSGTVSGFIAGGLGSMGVVTTDWIATGINTICYSPTPTGYIAATGSVSLYGAVDGDKLIINGEELFYGITSDPGFTYDFSDIDSLALLINSNTGRFMSTGIVRGTEVFLTSLYIGTSGNEIELYADNEAGDMTTSNDGNGFIGGEDLGLDSPLTPLTPFTGYVPLTTITGSGIYSGIATGIAYGTGDSLYLRKRLENTWNLSTGTNFNSLISYRDWNFYSGDLYSGHTNSTHGSFYIYVNYSTSVSSIDVAELTITGLGLPTGFNFTLSGV